MRIRVAVVAISLLVAAGSTAAQGPGGAPQPGPEHARLGFYVGSWKTTGTMMPGPLGPGGEITSTDACEWFEGGFAVVCRFSGKGPMGPMKGLGIIGYSPEEEVYTYYAVDNSPMAMTAAALGTFEDGTWTFNNDMLMGGETLHSRYIIKETSPTSYTFRWEMLGPDGSWMTVTEGKATKG